MWLLAVLILVCAGALGLINVDKIALWLLIGGSLVFVAWLVAAWRESGLFSETGRIWYVIGALVLLLGAAAAVFGG